MEKKKYVYSKEHRAKWYKTKVEASKNKPFTVYKIGNRIAIAHNDITKMQETLDKYYESLSNFACKPIHKVVVITQLQTRKEAEDYIEKNYRTIKKIESPLHSGSNMQGLTEEKYNWDYRFTCPTCGKSGFPTKYWLENHFDNCIYKEDEEEEQSF